MNRATEVLDVARIRLMAGTALTKHRQTFRLNTDCLSAYFYGWCVVVGAATCKGPSNRSVCDRVCPHLVNVVSNLVFAVCARQSSTLRHIASLRFISGTKFPLVGGRCSGMEFCRVYCAFCVDLRDIHGYLCFPAALWQMAVNNNWFPAVAQ